MGEHLWGPDVDGIGAEYEIEQLELGERASDELFHEWCVTKWQNREKPMVILLQGRLLAAGCSRIDVLLSSRLTRLGIRQTSMDRRTT